MAAAAALLEQLETRVFDLDARCEQTVQHARRAVLEQPSSVAARAAAVAPRDERAAEVVAEPEERAYLYSVEALRGDGSRRRRGYDVDIPRRRVAAAPRLRRG